MESKSVDNSKLLGLLLCLAIALPSYAAVKLMPALAVIGSPVIAILAGMLLTRFIKDKSRFKPGIAFTSKKILQTAVVLLGFGLNLSTVAQVGLNSIPVILSTISTSLLTAFVLCKAMKIHRNQAVLIGVGSSICGGSAIAATAPVIGADDQEIAQAISVVFVFNVIAALIFPTLGGMLGLSDAGFGLFAGTAINDTSSVTAAASTWDVLHNTGGSVMEYATIVKLTRTLAIIPITLALAIYETGRKRKLQEAQIDTICPAQIDKEASQFAGNIEGPEGLAAGNPSAGPEGLAGGKTPAGPEGFSLKRAFPMFILYFLLASVATTVITAAATGGALAAAESVFAGLKELSRFFIVMAMAAIGLNTDIVKLIKSGGKPIFLGLCCWVLIAIVSIIVQTALKLV